MMLTTKFFLTTVITAYLECHILAYSRKVLKSIRHQVKHDCVQRTDISESNILDNITIQDNLKLQLPMNGTVHTSLEMENKLLISQKKMIENISQIIDSRNYSSEIMQGVLEGIVADIIGASFNEQEVTFTSIDTVHLTMKSLLLDMLMNTATLFLPKIQNLLLKPKVSFDFVKSCYKPLVMLYLSFILYALHFQQFQLDDSDRLPYREPDLDGLENTTDYSQPATASLLFQLVLTMAKCILMPLLFHGLAHTLPSVTTHMGMEILRNVMGILHTIFNSDGDATAFANRLISV